jgi:shikimate kinase
MSAILFLIGLRGSGKSTVGRLLADRLNLPFVDADAELEAESGRTIREIVARDGEPAFRDLEEQILAKLIRRGPAVIATGGGVVMRESNRRRIRESGKAVWLTADVKTLSDRLACDPTTADRRPDLTVGGRAEIAQLHATREPMYRACADIIVDTAGRSPEQIAGDILLAWSTSSSNMA